MNTAARGGNDLGVCGAPSDPRGVQAAQAQVRGIAAATGPPPDDDTVKRLPEERAEKYG
jgi:hypothetical protein